MICANKTTDINESSTDGKLITDFGWPVPGGKVELFGDEGPSVLRNVLVVCP